MTYESKSQDGYRVLYAILAICHPKLKERSKMIQPTLRKTPNLFTYIRHLMSWLQFEKVQHRAYSDMEKLTIVMEELELDKRFDKACQLLRMKKNLHLNFLKQTPTVKFPPSLNLEQLPYTIMNAYQEDEREKLFGEDSTSDVEDSDDDGAEVHRLNSGGGRNGGQGRQRNPYNNTNNNYNNKFNKNQSFHSQPYHRRSFRPRLPETCPACGTYGHNAEKNGCDLTGQVLMILRYIKRQPKMIGSILKKHWDHQDNRKKTLGPYKSLNTRFQEHARNRNYNFSPQVRAIFDVVAETMEDLEREDEGIVHSLEDQNIEEEFGELWDSPAVKSLQEVDDFYDTAEDQEE